MKKIFLLLAASFLSHAFAEDPQGMQVMVELVSGTKQKAQFLGIANDTVSLGGYIKNEFTVLKFPKSQFKSILDSLGNQMWLYTGPSISTALRTSFFAAT